MVAFLRKAPGATDVLIACNFTPVPRTSYPLGVPQAGPWTVLLNSDDAIYGGSGAGSTGVLTAADHRRGVFAATIDLDLPPLGVLILLGVFLARRGLEAVLEGHAAEWHLNVMALTDAFMLLAVGLIIFQRVEMFIRARRIRAGRLDSHVEVVA